MGELYLYISSFLGHWWPLVSAGSILGLEEFAERYWRWASGHLKKVSNDRRRHLKVGALLFAALWSGYLSWQDEHQARLGAESKVSGPTRPQRFLSEDQKERLVKYGANVKAQLSDTWIWVAASEDTESERYAQNILHALRAAGLHVVYLGSSPVEVGDHDLAIQLRDPDHPTPNAKAVMELLSKSLIEYSVQLDPNDYPNGPEMEITVTPPKS